MMQPIQLYFLVYALFLIVSVRGANPVKWISQEQARYHLVKHSSATRREIGFELLRPEQTGVYFTNRLTDAMASSNQILLNGSGVALGDVDGDSLVDIYFCGLESENRLFRNLGGMRFADMTESAGVACSGQFSSGAALADIDGDSDLDLLVNALGQGTKLFLNDSTGKFTEKQDCGLMRRGGATSMALADVDGDGDLDLYVTNYRTTTVRTTGFALLNVNGKKMVRPEDRDHLEMTPDGKVIEHGEPDVFYINRGNAQFIQVPWTAGGFLDEEGNRLKKTPMDWGLSAMFRDINQDGLPDLYVCNDFHSPDRLWLNTGEGSFRAISKLAIRNSSTFSMSVDFADLDRDRNDDYFVADMLDRDRKRKMVQFTGTEPHQSTPGVFDDRPQYDRNTLQWNRGDGTYAEIAYYAGLEALGWTWCGAFLDVDLDGFEDLLATTGSLFDTQDLDAADRINAAGPWRPQDIPKKLLKYPRLELPKVAFRNGGNMRFKDMSAEWGFSDTGISHGMAFADLDNDGDQDVVVNNMNQAGGIYQNESDYSRLLVRLRGQPPNTRGIGARIRLVQGNFHQEQELISGGRYLSCDDASRTFAWRIGEPTSTLEVKWRSGAVTRLENVAPERCYEIFEPADLIPPITTEQNARPLFEDVSSILNHIHQENHFDDFARQPLLPRSLSQLGPGVAWLDMDHDGWEDLAVGGAVDSAIMLFRNNNGTNFSKWAKMPSSDTPREGAGLLALKMDKRNVAVLSAVSNYKGNLDQSSSVQLFNVQSSETKVLMMDGKQSIGALASADYDGDGDLDLFVAGRGVPGNYPAPAASIFLQREGSAWHVDQKNSLLLKQAGMVTGCLFSDLSNDGFPELILASEWGPLRVFHNERGQFKEITASTGLLQYPGLWNGVATCDLDEDGRLDIIAGNWGENTKYHASASAPLRIYYGDFDGNGTVDLIESYSDLSSRKEFPERHLKALRSSVPLMAEKFSTFASYAQATTEDFLGEFHRSSRVVEASTMSSMVFFNRGTFFEARALPWKAQLAPTFAVVAADFNGDGNDDVFLSQNFFAVEPTTSRHDAGQGILLYGDGRGTLEPVSSQASGIAVYGEQRGAAACDFDNDGRTDLVVTQNAGTTRMFRNRGGKSGLRVHLNGTIENPLAIGAAVRLKDSSSATPWREVQAGSGYWSQNSAKLILPQPDSAGVVEVRWPGGKITTKPVSEAAKEIIINHDE